jgi:hypothetical protein
MSEHPTADCEHDWFRDDDSRIDEKVCIKCGAIGTTCPKCDGVCLKGCDCDDSGMVVLTPKGR